MISPTTIDTVKDLEITEVIQRFGTPLKKRGAYHWACCPIHKEKTPSFAVSYAKQSFTCHGCHEYGNGVDFVMKVKGLDFYDTIKEIANEFGIPVEHDTSQQAADLAKVANRKRALADVTKIAFKFLKTKQPKVEMLQPWQAAIDTFHVMNGLDGWTTLTDHLKKEGVDMEQAASLKLIAKVTSGPNKGNFVDVLRNCIVFPLHDERGRVLGFAKRHLDAADVEKYGKYHNPAENDLYQKRKTLYGIYQAREAMEKSGECWLVEGYTDVISMHMIGLQNTVGKCGTALTREQAQLIRKYAKHVYIMGDGDTAGQTAANKDVEILLREGLTASLVTLPAHHDPDSFILENMAA